MIMEINSNSKIPRRNRNESLSPKNSPYKGEKISDTDKLEIAHLRCESLNTILSKRDQDLDELRKFTQEERESLQLLLDEQTILLNDKENNIKSINSINLNLISELITMKESFEALQNENLQNIPKVSQFQSYFS